MARRAQTLDPQLLRANKAASAAYAAGDKRFFDYLEGEARVFVLDAVEPLVGRKSFEGYFGKTFAKTKRKLSVMNSDWQVSGDQAILTQTLHITAHRVTSVIRQTVVWSKASGSWLIAHLHNAMVGQPVAVGPAPRTAEAVRVLNERIATVATAVGVAQ